MPDRELEEMQKLVREYRAAEAVLAAAKQVLHTHIVNRTVPTPEDNKAEIEARAHFVEARQKLYKT